MKEYLSTVFLLLGNKLRPKFRITEEEFRAIHEDQLWGWANPEAAYKRNELISTTTKS